MGKKKWYPKSQGAVGRGGGVVNGTQRGCGGKMAMSKKVAMAVARKKRRQGDVTMWAYECENCSGWHVGHSKIKSAEMGGGRGELSWYE